MSIYMEISCSSQSGAMAAQVDLTAPSNLRFPPTGGLDQAI
jgi:hypothetical protein